jgi:hypothetical protein
VQATGDLTTSHRIRRVRRTSSAPAGGSAICPHQEHRLLLSSLPGISIHQPTSQFTVLSSDPSSRRMPQRPVHLLGRFPSEQFNAREISV